MKVINRAKEKSAVQEAILADLAWHYCDDYDFDSYEYESDSYDRYFTLYECSDFVERNERLQIEPPVTLRWDNEWNTCAWCCHASCVDCNLFSSATITRSEVFRDIELRILSSLKARCPHTEVAEIVIALLDLEIIP